MTPPSVQLELLTVRRGPTLALDAVSAVFPAAATTALVGPNGSGKSTLLEVVAAAGKVALTASRARVAPRRTVRSSSCTHGGVMHPLYRE